MPIDVVMPRLGWTMEEGQVVEWFKQDGEAVEKGDILFAVEADKGVSDIEALESGILHILPDAPFGTDVPVGTRLAYIASPGEKVVLDEPESPPEPVRPDANGSEAEEPAEIATATGASSRRGNGPAISPRARRRAQELGMEWVTLRGSGRTGRIVERDILTAHNARSAEPRATPMVRRLAEELDVPLADIAGSTASGRITRADVRAAAERLNVGDDTSQGEPLSTYRKVISRRMSESARTTAPVTLTTEADATALIALRRQVTAELEGSDTSPPSVTDMLVRLTALALTQHTDLNASIDGDRLIVHGDVHIGVAVDSPRGLLVPVVRDAHRRSVFEIAEDSRALIAQARTGSIAVEHTQGGTFTVSNLGMFGIDAFTPIINLPECAVLGVGRIASRPVVVDEETEEIAVRKMMALSLTFDHRLVDGAPAARFLQLLVRMIERPVTWLMR